MTSSVPAIAYYEPMKETPEPPPVQPVAPPPVFLEVPSQENQLQQIADKVGFVPNLRLSDNLIQLAALLGGMLIFGLVGYAMRWGSADSPLMGAGLGAIAGMLIGTFLGGAYLAVKNAMRK